MPPVVGGENAALAAPGKRQCPLEGEVIGKANVPWKGKRAIEDGEGVLKSAVQQRTVDFDLLWRICYASSTKNKKCLAAWENLCYV
jgi:hypothetical protein